MNGGSGQSIPDVNWSMRSLLAATGLAMCLFMVAFSAAASSRNIKAAQAFEQELADEAELVAALAEHLAAETAAAAERLDAPRLKPARPLAERLEDGLRLAALAPLEDADVRAARLQAAEAECMAQAIYYEARSERRIGRLAVADVVLNRVESRIYPNTICGVVFQGSERTTGCQFSFTCDGSMDRPRNERLWRESELIAAAVLSGMRVPVTRDATHYHANYVDPYWAEKMTPTAVIGVHKFYRFSGRHVQYAAPAAM